MTKLHYGIANGKYKNPFFTVQTNKRTIIFEIHTCLTSIFKIKKIVDKNSKGFWHLSLSLSLLSITNFRRYA